MRAAPTDVTSERRQDRQLIGIGAGWPQSALDYLAGGELDTCEVVVIGRRERSLPRAACWFPTPEAFWGAEVGSGVPYLLWIPDPDGSATLRDGQLGDLARDVRCELGVALLAPPLQSSALLPRIGALMQAARSNGLRSRGIESCWSTGLGASGAVARRGVLLRFVAAGAHVYAPRDACAGARAPRLVAARQYAFAARYARAARVLDGSGGDGCGVAPLADLAREVVASADAVVRSALAPTARSPAEQPVAALSELRETSGSSPFDLVVCVDAVDSAASPPTSETLASLTACAGERGVLVISRRQLRRGLRAARSSEQVAGAVGLAEWEREWLATHFDHFELHTLGADGFELRGCGEATEGVPRFVQPAAESGHEAVTSGSPESVWAGADLDSLIVAARERLPASDSVDVWPHLEAALTEEESRRVYADWELSHLAHAGARRELEALLAGDDSGGSLRELWRRSIQLGRQWMLRWAAVPEFALPATADAAGQHPQLADFARWRAELRCLDRHCRALILDLRAVHQMRSFRTLRAVAARLRGVPYEQPSLPSYAPAPQLAYEAFDAACFEQLVLATRERHQEFGQLRSSATRLALLPFRIALRLQRARGARPSSESPVAGGHGLGDDSACWVSILLVAPRASREAAESFSSVLGQTDSNWQLLWVDGSAAEGAPAASCAGPASLQGPGGSQPLEGLQPDSRVTWLTTASEDLGADQWLRLMDSRWVAFLFPGECWPPDFLAHQRQILEGLAPDVVAALVDGASATNATGRVAAAGLIARRSALLHPRVLSSDALDAGADALDGSDDGSRDVRDRGRGMRRWAILVERLSSLGRVAGPLVSD